MTDIFSIIMLYDSELIKLKLISSNFNYGKNIENKKFITIYKPKEQLANHNANFPTTKDITINRVKIGLIRTSYTISTLATIWKETNKKTDLIHQNKFIRLIEN